MKSYYEYLIESDISDLEKLKSLALQYDDPYIFDDKLNRNSFGHDRDNCFLGERFKRLHRGTRLKGNNVIEIFRTGDSPIVWGDYVYNNYSDAKHAFDGGQGNKIYSRKIKESDLVETSIHGEFYYSPKNIAKLGEDLIDFWYNVHKIPNPDKIVINKKQENKEKKKIFREKVKNLGKFKSFEDYAYQVYKIAHDMKIDPFMINYEIYFKQG